MAQGGIINAAYDAADNIMTIKEQKTRKAKAKALAEKKLNESQKHSGSSSLF